MCCSSTMLTTFALRPGWAWHAANKVSPYLLLPFPCPNAEVAYFALLVPYSLHLLLTHCVQHDKSQIVNMNLTLQVVLYLMGAYSFIQVSYCTQFVCQSMDLVCAGYLVVGGKFDVATLKNLLWVHWWTIGVLALVVAVIELALLSQTCTFFLKLCNHSICFTVCREAMSPGNYKRHAYLLFNLAPIKW